MTMKMKRFFMVLFTRLRELKSSTGCNIDADLAILLIDYVNILFLNLFAFYVVALACCFAKQILQCFSSIHC